MSFRSISDSHFNNHKKIINMFRWVITFLIIALIAALFGFGNIAAGAASIARVLFYIFLVFFVISLVAGAIRGFK